jgi:hypothetical protein
MACRSLLLGALALLLAPAPAAGAGGDAEDMCRVVDVDFTPTQDLQIVVWLEDAQGAYVDTLLITDLTGRRGLGNRPGRMDFNSHWRWPYGRRVNTFPVWAHRHGRTWPLLIFQNDDGSHRVESDLSHPFNQSSVEAFFCRPIRPGEAMWDTQTCATTVYTDKGRMSPSEVTRYPPRRDLVYEQGIDDPSVQMFRELNPFDAVTAATPIGGLRYAMSWSIPEEVPPGDYVMWVEVSQEYDHNETYSVARYPAPVGIAYGDYGEPYRGQPSVVYRVPFTIGTELSVGLATEYAGYGDPEGLDGTLRPPDATISTNVPGSGAQRLLTTIAAGTTSRVRVTARLELDDVPPAAPGAGRVVDVTATTATIRFVEPGDDGLEGRATGYEIRYRAGVPISEETFFDGSPAAVQVTPEASGVTREVVIPNLLPQTTYWVGIRAYDDCKNYGPLAILELTTADRETGEVDACFVATAAYGSLLANEVERLRQVRDGILRSNVVGELLVEAYYTFGPALAGLVGESEELRGLARDLLTPLAGWLGGLSYHELADR